MNDRETRRKSGSSCIQFGRVPPLAFNRLRQHRVPQHIIKQCGVLEAIENLPASQRDRRKGKDRVGKETGLLHKSVKKTAQYLHLSRVRTRKPNCLSQSLTRPFCRHGWYETPNQHHTSFQILSLSEPAPVILCSACLPNQSETRSSIARCYSQQVHFPSLP